MKNFSLLPVSILLSALMPLVLTGQEKPDGPYVPSDKALDPKWDQTLFKKGEQMVYSGKELDKVAMPCGGIGAGQVEVTGFGRLILNESVFNQMQQPNAGHGLSTGYQYLNPQKLESKVGNGFAVTFKETGKSPVKLELNERGYNDIRFVGEYPLAQLQYKRSGEKLPVEISSEVFSPFVPLDVRSSANPVTVLKYSIRNSGEKSVDVTLSGWLKNFTFPEGVEVEQVKTIRNSKNVKGISFDLIPTGPDVDTSVHPQTGGFSLSVLDEKASCDIANGSVSTTLRLGPGESGEAVFLVTWYFPNYYENGRRYKQARAEAPGLVGHIYNNWYDSPFDVAEYVASDFERLYRQTRLFRDTYNDNTLPYWLSNRITMPVSTLAAGNVAIWENGRMYCYEGVGFCQGTCGHVYNFVVAISRLFPELERSVRLKQDLNETDPYGGYSSSGRINFRGYGANDPNAIHSYASDAQSGYVLKIYREHLLSPDYSFLDSVWEKTKQVIGFQIFKDGAEIGMDPNGVLEGEQTFWDPMFYGPNPYNNTLYLAALRAAEEMARIKGEEALADRYHSIFKKGRQYMNDVMWNGEYYVHIYPTGFMGNVGVRNGFKLPVEIENNARKYIDAFNSGEPSYFVSTACDANQLFGQNWANQLGLGYILPPENCRKAGESIYLYNWTPDISTIYDFGKPKHRTLAAPGERALINGSWPKEKARNFENTHDKSDIWTGLEYEAACDMINEGLVKEGLSVIRAIHDRYDGTKRNPWNEIEGSDHYSRAMHSWNILLSLSGFMYDGPAGVMGFNPRITPEDFKCFFTVAEGWGNISQTINGNLREAVIDLKWGTLGLTKLKFSAGNGIKTSEILVTMDGKAIPVSHEIQNGEITVSLAHPLILETGSQLKVQIR